MPSIDCGIYKNKANRFNVNKITLEYENTSFINKVSVQ